MNYKRKRVLQKVFGMALAAALVLGVPCSTALAVEEIPVEALEAELERTELERTEPEQTEPELGEAPLGDAEGEPVCHIDIIGHNVSVDSIAEGLSVRLSTVTMQSAAVIGVKGIVLEEKNLLGWSKVYPSDAESDGFAAYATNSVEGSFVYGDAVYNRKYRVKCTHYANADSYAEVKVETSAYTYTYRK